MKTAPVSNQRLKVSAARENRSRNLYAEVSMIQNLKQMDPLDFYEGFVLGFHGWRHLRTQQDQVSVATMHLSPLLTHTFMLIRSCEPFSH